MGSPKRVDVLENDLYKKDSIDVIHRACVSGFNVSSMTCKSLELKRGPSIESSDDTLASFRTVNIISSISQGRMMLEIRNSVIWW